MSIMLRSALLESFLSNAHRWCQPKACMSEAERCDINAGTRPVTHMISILQAVFCRHGADTLAMLQKSKVSAVRM